jgi:FGGY-family pentulose kinase
VRGISYDATCSLVALDAANRPITISPSGDPRWNVVMWMDHRAIEFAEQINTTGHEVLKFVGGKISPEMEPPKLKWIKENLPHTWSQAAKFFDLADFMVYQSCGNDVRSLCTLVCKWCYLGHEGEYGRWSTDFYQQIGLGDIFEGARVTDTVRPMGTRAGGLTSEAARHLGLPPDTPVGVGIIDAHAGGLGVLGAVWEEEEGTPLDKLETAVAYIGGTSACIMAVARQPVFVKGVWGPYYSAMVPGMWLTEGGQSAAGGLLDYVVDDSAQGSALKKQAASAGRSVYEILNDIVAQQTAQHGPLWTHDLHVVGNHHGNRSPHADPFSKGIIDGLTLDTSVESLAKRYYATVQALAFSTREVIELLNQNGYRIDKIFACGGGTKNPVWLQEHANICECSIVLPREPEAVLLGTAMLAAVAAGCYPSIPAAMHGMSHAGETILPRTSHRDYYDAKFAIYQQMYREHLTRRAQMARFKNAT